MYNRTHAHPYTLTYMYTHATVCSTVLTYVLPISLLSRAVTVKCDVHVPASPVIHEVSALFMNDEFMGYIVTIQDEVDARRVGPLYQIYMKRHSHLVDHEDELEGDIAKRLVDIKVGVHFFGVWCVVPLYGYTCDVWYLSTNTSVMCGTSTDTSVVCGTSLLIQLWCVVPLQYKCGVWYLSADTSVVCGTSLPIQLWCLVPLC